MSNPSLFPNRALILVLGAALVAFAVKCAWALNSFGSSDLIFFHSFAQQLTEVGLAETYRSNPMFNHTPLTALFLRALFWVAHGDLISFSSAFRVVTSLADLGTIGALLFVQKRSARPAWWALGLFAASPVSIMISGFHGNVDPLMVLFLAWAAAALLARQPLWCGALFALACEVKIVPVLLMPLFVLWWWRHDRRACGKFVALAAAMLLLGSAVPLFQCPAAYLHNVFGYGSYWGTWGVTYWLHQTGADIFHLVDYKDLSTAQERVAFDLKLLMVIGLLILAWRRRGVEASHFFTSLAAAFTIILALAPGLGPQYLVWIAPFLAWSRPRWYAVLTACSSVYMFAFYHPASKYVFPWELAFPKGWEIAVWGPWMNLPWATLLALLVVERRRWWLAGQDGEKPTAPALIT